MNAHPPMSSAPARRQTATAVTARTGAHAGDDTAGAALSTTASVITDGGKVWGGGEGGGGRHSSSGTGGAEAPMEEPQRDKRGRAVADDLASRPGVAQSAPSTAVHDPWRGDPRMWSTLCRCCCQSSKKVAKRKQ